MPTEIYDWTNAIHTGDLNGRSKTDDIRDALEGEKRVDA